MGQLNAQLVRAAGLGPYFQPRQAAVLGFALKSAITPGEHPACGA